jgi:hypothetical protein
VIANSLMIRFVIWFGFRRLCVWLRLVGCNIRRIEFSGGEQISM